MGAQISLPNPPGLLATDSRLHLYIVIAKKVFHKGIETLTTCIFYIATFERCGNEYAADTEVSKIAEIRQCKWLMDKLHLLLYLLQFLKHLKSF